MRKRNFKNSVITALNTCAILVELISESKKFLIQRSNKCLGYRGVLVSFQYTDVTTKVYL